MSIQLSKFLDKKKQNVQLHENIKVIAAAADSIVNHALSKSNDTILYGAYEASHREFSIGNFRNWGSLNSRSEIPGNFKGFWFVKNLCAKF